MQKKGVLELEGVDTILAQNKLMHQQIQQQMEMMAKRIDSLQLASVSTTNQASIEWGQNEAGNIEQQQEQVQYMQNTSNPSQNDFHGDTYNSSWRNHPNLRWGDNQNSWQRNHNFNNSRNTNNQNHSPSNTNQYKNSQNTYHPPHNNSQTHQNNFSTLPFNSQNNHLNAPNNLHQQPSPTIQPHPDSQRISNLEMLMEKLIKTQEMARQDQALTLKNQDASMKNLERQMGQMAKHITEIGEKRALPSTTEDNPRDTGKAIKWEECKAITLRSGKKVETEAITKEEHNKEGLKEEVREQKQEQETSTQSDKLAKKEEMKSYQPMIPYPQ
ncbi:serine/threonine-protein kinase atg1-like, partial [Arachis ipaensis]|uniref:serine/threonine-protein kinase atg1-like n=1 Tax=Arachis ipaensis TaxID=130454 RepID=UPI0007AF91D8